VNFACTQGGFPISGGAQTPQGLAGVAITSDAPLQDTGTPVDWNITVTNVSGQPISVGLKIVCVTGAGGSSAANSRAGKVQHAIIVKKTIKKIRNLAKH